MNKLIITLLLALVPANAQTGFWAFNSFLYFEYLGNPTIYESFVSGGSPCYAWVGGGTPSSAQPACFYDPTNTNAGY